MSHDMEAAGAAALGGLTSGDHHPVTQGEPCRNCGGPVDARYCSRCGQLASNFHRPFFSLVMSSLADTFALDSRLWRSVPLLLFRPGRMTRNYLDGKRARYVPPFRLFLLASVLFFLTVFGLGERLGWYQNWELNPGSAVSMSEEERAQVKAAVEKQLADETLDPTSRAGLEIALKNLESGSSIPFMNEETGTVDRDALNEMIDLTTDENASPEEVETIRGAGERLANVLENQDRFGARMREWAPRFSLMFMPLLALMLTVMYAWHRRVYVYDHVITALHFQTFVYSLLTLLLLVGAFLHVGAGWLSAIGIVWGVWYLHRQLRVAYGTGFFMAALRTSILLILGITVLFLLALGLVILSFLLT
ncbi:MULTISPECIES: DUF3667 domain-containing protein [unclassified Hyphomonas]|uniref:DUF3667 domain-containing protein n=1 Tax=unclassified Hyphomonas TaxID=2630699 RepID=UPI000458FD53|nr:MULTISPECIES: DUF3667 domain-containing protein [unclassified Hyphomonas]KCZ48003.1 hypothetical protein HY17_18305 [Hyphomonas sp. CY54-11-8]RAN40476.1 hypothetical protein HY26_01810 [Hyphomonas sp. GM-8P]